MTGAEEPGAGATATHLASPPGQSPAALDRAGIAARIPHAGRMCLLDQLLDWTAATVRCSATSHTDPDHPLREPDGLPATTAIEYAAQAMALHGGLLAAPGSVPSAGYIASVRGVRLHQPWLHTVPGAITVTTERLAGDERQVMYQFSLQAADGTPLADGRATVVLNTPLAPPDPTPIDRRA